LLATFKYLCFNGYLLGEPELAFLHFLSFVPEKNWA